MACYACIWKRKDLNYYNVNWNDDDGTILLAVYHLLQVPKQPPDIKAKLSARNCRWQSHDLGDCYKDNNCYIVMVKN